MSCPKSRSNNGTATLNRCNIIREPYEKTEISDVEWLPGDSNPAKDLTKMDKRNGTLANIISTNNFKPKIVSWVVKDASELKSMETAAEG